MRRRITVGVAIIASTLAAAYTATVVGNETTYSPTVLTAPTVTGTAEVGQELSCAPGTWKRSPTSYMIKWENAATSAEVALGSPYVPTAADEGDTLRCRVTAANARGSGQALSTAVGPVPVPNPLLIVSDSFTDTDDTNLSAHTGEVGATWTKHPSLTRDTFITENRARGDGNTGRARYYASGVPTSADYDVEGVFYWRTAGVASSLPAIWGRLSTSTDTGYQARWSATVSGFELMKVVAGAATRLGSVYADSPAADATRTVKLEMRVCEIKMYVENVLRVSATDCSITAAGRAGIGTRTSTALTGIHIDSVQATLPSPTPPECSDGDDDDADTLIDYPADPGCENANDNDEFNAPLPKCSNFIDDDGDTFIDFPADGGCAATTDDDETAPPVYICSDGLDNDGDGDIDFPDDIGCTDAQDANEFNQPVALCADGIDNDSPPDGLIDFGIGPTNDPGCADADDNDEFDEPPPPPPGTDLANVFVSLPGGTCTRFTTPSEYVAAAACGPGIAGQGGHIQTGIYASASNDTIRVKPGAYTATQQLAFTGRTGTLIIMDPGITFTQICFGNGSSSSCDGTTNDPASDITLRGADTRYFGISTTYRNGLRSEDVTFEGGKFAAGALRPNSTVRWTLKDATVYGNCCSTDGMTVTYSTGTFTEDMTILRMLMKNQAQTCADYPGPDDGFGVSLEACTGSTTLSSQVTMPATTIPVVGPIYSANTGTSAASDVRVGGGSPADCQNSSSTPTTTTIFKNCTGGTAGTYPAGTVVTYELRNNGNHTDCLQFFGGKNTLIDSSRFYNCATQGIFAGGSGGIVSPVGDPCPSTSFGCYSGFFRVVNTMVGPIPHPGTALNIGRGGSTDPGFASDAVVDVTDSAVYGSISVDTEGDVPASINIRNTLRLTQTFSPCAEIPSRPPTFRNNMTNAKSCDASDIVISTAAFNAMFNSIATITPDLHLVPGAPAIDAAHATLFPPTDIDGDPRPLGAGADIGADEKS